MSRCLDFRTAARRNVNVIPAFCWYLWYLFDRRYLPMMTSSWTGPSNSHSCRILSVLVQIITRVWFHYFETLIIKTMECKQIYIQLHAEWKWISNNYKPRILQTVRTFVDIQGMMYLHKSPFQSHGRLTSQNCRVDNRWVLKISWLWAERISAPGRRLPNPEMKDIEICCGRPRNCSGWRRHPPMERRRGTPSALPSFSMK